MTRKTTKQLIWQAMELAYDIDLHHMGIKPLSQASLESKNELNMEANKELERRFNAGDKDMLVFFHQRLGLIQKATECSHEFIEQQVGLFKMLAAIEVEKS